TTYTYTLSLHDALPICLHERRRQRARAAIDLGIEVDGDVSLPHHAAVRHRGRHRLPAGVRRRRAVDVARRRDADQYRVLPVQERSEEHTSELQSRENLV